MKDTTKYLIHANITAAGIVERSDVVGAVFGQTEGLLGEEMDLRNLQESKKVGRIDVEIRSEAGQTFGEITIASGLDRVETATLAAALETIEQVGPCQAEIEVANIEDVRSAKRREVIERATELLSEFEAESMQSEDIIETVRQKVRVADITEYEGLPAGPRVADSDAIVIVEGRSDVLQLLKYGIKNAVAVEGTDVPESVATLTADRTVTAFLDGDRGGDLILKELAQVGHVDYVAITPREKSVEDLSRGEVMAALRDKLPYDAVADADSPAAAIENAGSEEEARTDGSAAIDPTAAENSEPQTEQPPAVASADSGTRAVVADETHQSEAETETQESTPETSASGETTAAEGTETGEPATLSAHVDDVIRAGSETVRLLSAESELLDEGPVDDAVSLIEQSDPRPQTVVLDGECTQKIVDVAAQRGVEVIVASSDGEYVKQPTSVQVRIES